ncbi:DUF4224 domain-containing protein [Bergeriella denitrificans]|uniref:DUF4224 domain-containing protein n=1 Tax=Bergeriella denitrificans TaxID=494 RepID=A0A378URC5_BERDE|nr:DUF4224 domain-containing protein [Bergeriella denitrificans]STZ77385.1 Uncharacterised protein [Bergeriella denitrificans]STZ83005.1 Uncharacterised protein [Bergeriella denitrificans]
MSAFLTREELKELTGRSHPRRQIEVLKQNRIPFTTTAAGRPVVAWETLYGKRTKAPAVQEPTWQPAVLFNTA